MKKSVLAILLFLLLFVAGSCINENNVEKAREWPTKLVNVPDYMERISNPPPDMDEEHQRIWSEVIFMTAMEISRLSQAGADISQFPKPDNPQQLKEMVDDLPGEEFHRVVLAFWLAQEISDEIVLFSAGLRRSELEQGGGNLLHRLTNEAGQPLGYFGSEEDFVPIFAIRWNDQTNLFDVGMNENAIRSLQGSIQNMPAA